MKLLQPITYRGQVVAVATAERFFLADELDRMPQDEPERRFVIWMCDYAGMVLRGDRTGPYSDDEACRHARGALIPGELAERPIPNINRTAWALRVPADEIRAAQLDHQRAGRLENL